ncbi:RNA recognition motif [Medicago truncatula]|uniref:RNA recognition motif n=1 Tax=Medicago truncatula TaxID=3880 RepID=G7KI98_MEDTR|nr:RNA recognition motif [Medicago truncatula]
MRRERGAIVRERSGSFEGNLRQPRRHHSPAYGREGTPAGVAQRGGDSGEWTTVSYRRRKAIRPGVRGQDRHRVSSRQGGYREDRFQSSGRHQEVHSQDSRFLSCDSRDFDFLGFRRYNNSRHQYHARTSHSRPRYHHPRPGFSRNHCSRPAASRHHLSGSHYNHYRPASLHLHQKHPRPASLQHHSRPASARRGRSTSRHTVQSSDHSSRHVSISSAPHATSKGNNYASRASFYVANLPDNAHYVDIRKAFEVCGILSDVYVARNRNARGQNYGFVRFIKVKDVVKLQKALNNVSLGQYRVWANIARFDRFGEVRKELLKELEDGKKSAEVGGKNKSKNMFEEALARKQALEQVKLDAKVSEEEREKARLSAVVVGDISCSVKENKNHY